MWEGYINRLRHSGQLASQKKRFPAKKQRVRKGMQDKLSLSAESVWRDGHIGEGMIY